MAKASASFTIMDYTDGVTLLGSIDSNLVKTVLYDTTTQTYSPSWASTALTLTPTLHKAGSGTDLIGVVISPKWFRKISGGSWVQVTSGSNGETIASSTKILTVNQDKMVGDIWQIEYKFTCIYHDPVLNLDLDYEMVISFSKVANGTSFVVARAFAPGGNQFKNEQPASLTITAELIRGTAKDSTLVGYAWEKSTNGSTWTAVTGSTANLSVTPAMVSSFAMFRCKITDNDPASETYQDVFVTEGVTILDITDPYQIDIRSTGGNFFKNDTGTSTLTARVYRDGVEIDTGGTELTYTWTMADQDGVNVASAGAITFPKTGKTLTVTHDMINVKGTFFCEIS